MGKNTEDFCLMKKVGTLFLVAHCLKSAAICLLSNRLCVDAFGWLLVCGQLLKFWNIMRFQEFQNWNVFQGILNNFGGQRYIFFAISKRVFTARNCSCRKVMFSWASVSHSVHGKGDFLSHVPSGYHVPSWRGEGMPSSLAVLNLCTITPEWQHNFIWKYFIVFVLVFLQVWWTWT